MKAPGLPADQQFFADLFSGLVLNPQLLGRVWFASQPASLPVGSLCIEGTVTVIDPVNHMTIVMLSNKPHSPVADPQKNPNMFESGQLPIATYGWVVDQVYAALKQK